MFQILSEKSYWIILLKKVNLWYRSENLLKQILLQVFLNYCTNILVVDFEYFPRNFFRFAKEVRLKNFRIERKALVPESSFKVAGCFKKKLWQWSFSVNFAKLLRIAMLRSAPFLKKWFVFNCLNMKNESAGYFLI